MSDLMKFVNFILLGPNPILSNQLQDDSGQSRTLLHEHTVNKADHQPIRLIHSYVQLITNHCVIWGPDLKPKAIQALILFLHFFDKTKSGSITMPEQTSACHIITNISIHWFVHKGCQHETATGLTTSDGFQF